jgi:hypothetical protein
MLLSDPAIFSREHYEACRGFSPPWLAELVVHCLELVAQLGSTGFDFLFKGGNSQLLLLDDPQRFSIDVDIACLASPEEVTALVQKVIDQCEVYTEFEIRKHVTKPWLNMISYKLFFNSVYQKAEDSFVMLDAVLKIPPYAGIQKPVRCLDIYSANVEVKVPGIAGLIADKLLTIGPATLGIPLGKNKEAHRLKHVFDVAWLLRHPFDAELMRKSLHKCIEQENSLQRSDWSLEAVVDDTIAFCEEPLSITEHVAPESVEGKDYLREICIGFDEFRHHLFRQLYTWQQLQEDCRRIIDLCRTLS